ERRARGVEVAVGVEPDQSDAGIRPMHVLPATEYAGDVRAIPADHHRRLALAHAAGHGVSDLASDRPQVSGRALDAPLLRKLRIDEGRHLLQLAVGARMAVIIDRALVPI